MTLVVQIDKVDYSSSIEPKLYSKRLTRLQEQLKSQGLIEPLMVIGQTNWRLLGEPHHNNLLYAARSLDWKTVIIAWRLIPFGPGRAMGASK